MWCLTKEECQAWFSGHGFTGKPSDRISARTAGSTVSLPLSNLGFSRFTWLSKFIANSLAGSDETLLWISLWGVWPSSENLHLFYRLRESYGERRPLEDAPGHRFLPHETADLASFIQLALLFGWDFYVIGVPNYITGFATHDEFFDFASERADGCDEIKAALAAANMKIR